MLPTPLSWTEKNVVLGTAGRGEVSSGYFESLYGAAFGDPSLASRDLRSEMTEKIMEFLQEMDAGPTYSVKELHDATVRMIDWYDEQGEDWPLNYDPELSNPDLATRIFVNYTADAGPGYIREN